MQCLAATELNLGAKEPELQCLPTGRGTTVVTSDHDGVAIAAGDAATVVAAAGLNPEAKEPESQSAAALARPPRLVEGTSDDLVRRRDKLEQKLGRAERVLLKLENRS